MHILEDLKSRGLIYQTTNYDGLYKKLKSPPVFLYVGFDPTADSLHIGNLLQIITLIRFSKAGHFLVVVNGTTTGLIGDPSGKKSERPLLAKKDLLKNAHNIKKQLKQILKPVKKSVKIITNHQWFDKINIIDFFRDIGKHFPIGYMLAKDSVKSRMSSGISFTEFSYMVLQAYDYLKLNKKFNCELQIGGSDQWGNITAGVDLIRKSLSKEVYGLTLPLITSPDGSKLGKSVKNGIWLDPNRTNAYQFYQFWVNTSDEQVIQFIKYFTFLNKQKIQKLADKVKAEPAKREAQKILAKELTQFIHGQSAMLKAQKISQTLFSEKLELLSKNEIQQAFVNVPSISMSKQSEIDLIDALVLIKACASKTQAREHIKGGGIYINGHKCNPSKQTINTTDRLRGKYTIIRKGKKKYSKWNKED